MDGQKKRDTLADMPHFGGRSVQETEVFLVWLKEMYKKIKLDTGEVGVRSQGQGLERRHMNGR